MKSKKLFPKSEEKRFEARIKIYFCGAMNAAQIISKRKQPKP